MGKSKKVLDPGPVSWTESETSELITLVKDNTPLYDSNNKYYTNRKYIENIWRDIDIHFHKPPGTSHEKWSRLRVTYRKYKTSKDSDNKVLWKYYNQLDFLGAHLRKVPEKNSLKNSIEKILKTNNVVNEEAELSDEIEIFVNCDDIIEEDTDRISIIDEEQTVVNNSPDETANKRKQIDLIKFDENDTAEMEKMDVKRVKISEPDLTENINVYNCSNTNDPDIMYLNSLLPDIKLMSRKQKGLFKIKLQQIMHDILYADDD